MGKRLDEKVEENFNKGIMNYLDAWYNDRLYAPLGVSLRVKDELCLNVTLYCKHDDENKKNVPFTIHLEFIIEGNNGFENFWDEEDEVKYFENYDVKKPKNEMDFFKKVYDVVDDFMKEYKEEALESMEKMKNKSTNENKENRIMRKKMSKKSKLYEEGRLNLARKEFNKARKFLEDKGIEIEDTVVDFKRDENETLFYEIKLSDEIDKNTFNELKNEIETSFNVKNVYYTLVNGPLILMDFAENNELKESKKQFKKFNSKAINEAELTELKEAIINREEFVDENVVGTSIGEDYIVSVFDKAVLIFTSDNTPFIIGREDLTEEEMDIVEELYSVLEISVDIDDEDDYEEDEEIFVDDNTSDDLEMSEKTLKESSYPKANKELKSVLKDLKDEFEISSSEVDKGVHGNDYAEEQGYDYLYVGKITYKNEVSKDMLEEYKEWYEDVYGGKFDYDLNDKTIEVELGYGDDNDMIISMEKFIYESKNKKPSSFKKSLKESKKSKVKTLIKESGERVTTFKKGFNFKKYKSKA